MILAIEIMKNVAAKAGLPDSTWNSKAILAPNNQIKSETQRNKICLYIDVFLDLMPFFIIDNGGFFSQVGH